MDSCLFLNFEKYYYTHTNFVYIWIFSTFRFKFCKSMILSALDEIDRVATNFVRVFHINMFKKYNKRERGRRVWQLNHNELVIFLFQRNESNSSIKKYFKFQCKILNCLNYFMGFNCIKMSWTSKECSYELLNFKKIFYFNFYYNIIIRKNEVFDLIRSISVDSFNSDFMINFLIPLPMKINKKI